MMNCCVILTMMMITVEALVGGHPQGMKRMSITGAGGLRECKNTEVVWELRKTGFVKAVVSRAVHLQGCPLGELLLHNDTVIMMMMTIIFHSWPIMVTTY